MDKQIRKLRSLVKLHIGQTKTELENQYGKLGENSDNEVWFYCKYRWGIFKDEIAFFFEDNYVVDISITEYILGKEYRNIFYYEGQNPEYKVVNIM